jgi:hypothetical protein
MPDVIFHFMRLFSHVDVTERSQAGERNFSFAIVIYYIHERMEKSFPCVIQIYYEMLRIFMVSISII